MGRRVPSRVSRQWLSSMAPPFPPVGPGEPGSPPSSVLRRRYDFPPAQSLVAYVFAPRAPVLLPCSCSPKRSRGSGGLLPGLGQLVSRRPGSGVPARGHVRDLSGSLAIYPAPLPCSETPVEPTRPRHYRPCRCCPRSQHSEGFDFIMISGLTHGFDASCLRFTTGVAAAHARLASGWRAAPLPGGSRTLWIASKGFELHVHPPSQGLP